MKSSSKPKGGMLMTYGYARVSTADQRLERQTDALKNYGVDTIYCEKMTGTKKNRPELDRLLCDVQPGDTIVIESLSRLGRSVKNLAELMEQLNEKRVRVISMKEVIDTVTPTGKLLFTILSSLAQFERDVLAERTAEGLKAARARGHLGGRPKTDESKTQKALALYDTKQYTAAEITALTGVSRTVLYRAVNGRKSAR